MMKNLIFAISYLFCLVSVPASMCAQDLIIDFEKQDDSNKRSRKFVLKGHVDPNIQDSCYNIYITNFNGQITDADFFTRVPVKDKTFRFETELDEIKQGRIRAIFPGDELCSAWIDTYFIPGFTLDMTVHNGYYNINNRPQYDAELEEWSYYYPEQPPYDLKKRTLEYKIKREEKLTKLRAALDPYEILLSNLKDQISIIESSYISYFERTKRIAILCTKMEKITEKMEKLIDEYVKNMD